MLGEQNFRVFTVSAVPEPSAIILVAGAGITRAQDALDRIVYDTSSGILYYDADGAGGAAAVQFAGAGVPSLTIKIPSRYTHGPVEVCSLADVAATADLVAGALCAITALENARTVPPRLAVCGITL